LEDGLSHTEGHFFYTQVHTGVFENVVGYSQTHLKTTGTHFVEICFVVESLKTLLNFGNTLEGKFSFTDRHQSSEQASLYFEERGSLVFSEQVLDKEVAIKASGFKIKQLEKGPGQELKGKILVRHDLRALTLVANTNDVEAALNLLGLSVAHLLNKAEHLSAVHCVALFFANFFHLFLFFLFMCSSWLGSGFSRGTLLGIGFRALLFAFAWLHGQASK
jgi:hypothetical protein